GGYPRELPLERLHGAPLRLAQARALATRPSATLAAGARLLHDRDCAPTGTRLPSPPGPLLLLARRRRRGLLRPAVAAVGVARARRLASAPLARRGAVARCSRLLRAARRRRRSGPRRQRLRHREEPLDRELLADRPDV